MKYISIFLTLIIAINLNAALAAINVYTPNADGGPTDYFIKNIILPAIKKMTGADVSIYKASTDIEKIINDVKANPNSIVIMTDANVARYEKLATTKIINNLNINSVLAITPVVLFKSIKSKVDWRSLSDREVNIGYIEGSSSERCAMQMKLAYGDKMQLIKIKSEAEVMIQIMAAAIDGFCTASLLNITAHIQAGHIAPIAVAEKFTFSPYNNIEPYFPGGKVITARSFLAVFSSTKSVEGDVLAKKLTEFFQKDPSSIAAFNKIYLQPVLPEK